MIKLKFPIDKIDKHTKQKEIPTLREIIEKINEIIDYINKINTKKATD